MSFIASGLPYGRLPDAHILFSHLSVGTILSKLYAANQHVPWYGLYLSVFNFFSTGLIFFCFLWRKPFKKNALFAIVFFLVAVLHTIVSLQFTTVAAFLCIADIFLLLRLSEQKQTNWLAYAFSVAIFVVASNIRIEISLLFLCLGSFLFLCKSNLEWKKIGIALGVMILAFASCFALHKWNFAAYNSEPGWHHFLDANRLSAPFTNYGYVKPVLEGNPKIKAAGWTPVDGYMLCNWNYTDRRNFSLEKFEKMQSLISGSEVSIPMKLLEMKSMFTHILLLPLIMTFGVSCALLSTREKIKSLLYFAGTIALLSLMSVLMKVEPRVYFPMFCLAALLPFWACAEQFDSALSLTALKSRWLTKKRFMFVLLPLILASFFSSYFWVNECLLAKVRESLQLHKELITSLNLLKPSKRDLYFSWGYPYGGIRPYDDLTSYFANMTICPTASLCQSPVVTDVLRAYGIRDLARELDNPHLFFISNDFCNDLMIAYVAQHYGLDFQYKEISSFGPAKVWQWRRGKMPSTASFWNCSPAHTDREMVLYPASNRAWTLNQMFEAKPKRFQFVDDFFAQFQNWTEKMGCSHCLSKPGAATLFQSTGRLPTMSYFGSLSVDAQDYSTFFIELKAPKNVQINREVCVEYNLGGQHPRKFFMPMQLDEQMHRYEFDLRKLGLLPHEKISQLNVYPVYLREPGEHAQFKVKTFGFAHNQDGLRMEEKPAVRRPQ